MKKLTSLLILTTLFLLQACYRPQGQTWQPKGHGSLSSKKPKAYRK